MEEGGCSEKKSGMTRGRELPINSKVRRQLFPEDVSPRKQSTWNGEDYLGKVVNREYIARTLNNDIILKGMKWNFDFLTESPTSGRIKWYKEQNTGQWVGMQPSGQSLSIRKRMKSGAGIKSLYADERSKKRRLPYHTVAQRRSFFDDGRALECAMTQCDNENFINGFIIDSPTFYHQDAHSDCDHLPLDGPVHWQRVGDTWMRVQSGPSGQSTASGASQLNDSSATNPDRNSSTNSDDGDSTDDEYGDIKKRRKESKKDQEDLLEEETVELNEINYDSYKTDGDMKIIDVETAKEGIKNEDEILAKENFKNLKISDTTDADMQDRNEVTPKNASNRPASSNQVLPSQPMKKKARRKLFDYRFDI